MKSQNKDYLIAISLTVFLTASGFFLKSYFNTSDQIMFYLIGVVLAAWRLGRAPAMLSAILNVICLNFFFIDPIFTFEIADHSYWLTFVVVLVTSWVISTQAEHLRHQSRMAFKRELETQALYSLSKDLGSFRALDEVMEITLHHLDEALKGHSSIWFMTPEKTLSFYDMNPKSQNQDGKEEVMARWCIDNAKPAGLGTNTLPGSEVYYYPLQGAIQILGAISYRPITQLSQDEKTTVETFAHLIVSALERIEATKNAENMRLENETERLKNIFLNSMSHDLRTPLASICGGAETLLTADKKLNSTRKKQILTAIHSQADRLSRVVNNLLDLTRYESGQLRLDRQSYFLQELIGSALQSLQSKIIRQKIDISLPVDLPMIQVDGLLFEQMLQNLLDNALHFSPVEGIIKISSSHDESGLDLCIADQGPGISTGFEKKIFDKFFTIQQQDRPKGAGLGLAICQAIISAHGGKIWVSDNPQGGAAFHIFLPKDALIEPFLENELSA